MKHRPFFKFPGIAFVAIFSLACLGTIFFSSPFLIFSAGMRGTLWDRFHALWRVTAEQRLVFLLFASIIAGVTRIWRRHPRLVPAYGTWLSTTPWRPGVELPLGPINLAWEDLLFIFPTAVLMAWDYGVHLVFMPVASYMIGYSLTSLTVLRGNRAVWTLFAWLYLWTTAPLCGQGIWLIIAATAMLSQWAMHCSIADFPWDLPDGLSQLKKQKNLSLAWPMNRLGPTAPKSPMSHKMAWIAAALVGWMVFVGLTLKAKDSPEDAKDFALDMWLICILIGLGRAVIYCVAYWPPITWWGRFRTGYWIITGYDHVFITPVLMCIAAVILPLILPVGPYVSAAVTITVVAGTGLSGGPSVRAWRLTGHHRLLVPPRREPSIRLNAR